LPDELLADVSDIKVAFVPIPYKPYPFEPGCDHGLVCRLLLAIPVMLAFDIFEVADGLADRPKAS